MFLLFPYPAACYTLLSVLFLAMLGLCCSMGFSLVVASWRLFSSSTWASHCGGLSCCGAQALVIAVPGL